MATTVGRRINGGLSVLIKDAMLDPVYALLQERYFGANSSDYIRTLDELMYIYTQLCQMFQIQLYQKDNKWYTHHTSGHDSWQEAVIAAVYNLTNGEF